MAGMTISAFNVMLDALSPRMVQVSLHTDDPGTTGANEVTGGTYARQSVAWDAATAAQIVTNVLPQFEVPAGVTVTHVGLWENNDTTFSAGIALLNPEPFTNDGQLTVDEMTVTLQNA